MFNKIANCILNETLLVVGASDRVIGESVFRIGEVEFYFNDNDQHQDTFTHNDD
jgi:hypothetical protein